MMNSLKLLFSDFHWSNYLIRKTVLYQLTKLSFWIFSSSFPYSFPLQQI